MASGSKRKWQYISACYAATLLAGSDFAAAQAGDSAALAPTPEESAAAFPDLGEMNIQSMMIEDPLTSMVLFDQLEAQEGDDVFNWDVSAWVGRDLNKLLIRSEGEREGGDTQHAELELLWAHTIGAWWDLVAGLRHDFAPGPDRSWAAFGVRGAAPYEFELEATAFVGDGGQLSARFNVEYELLITQRLVLQPLFELNWYRKDDPQRQLGSGLATAEAGLRLRYEIRREVAPYIGVSRSRRFGNSADLARALGREAGDTRLLAGIRVWF